MAVIQIMFRSMCWLYYALLYKAFCKEIFVQHLCQRILTNHSFSTIGKFLCFIAVFVFKDFIVHSETPIEFFIKGRVTCLVKQLQQDWNLLTA